MRDLAWAFTICFMVLGPLKAVPVFFHATRGADRRTALVLAIRSTLLATAIVLFVALSASGTLLKWRVSMEAVAIAGGLVLLSTSLKTLATFELVEAPANGGGASPPPPSTRWLGRPVLSPLVTPAIVPPVAVVAILYFAGLGLSDPGFQAQLVALLVGIMAINFLAMLLAAPIMRLVGGPALQILGWVFSALQAGLAIQILLDALRAAGTI